MKTQRMKKTGIAALSMILILGWTLPALANTSINRGYTSFSEDAIILQPGWVASCHKDFLVENLGDSEAEIFISLGIELFSKDRVLANSKRLYDMRENLALAKQLGKSVTMTDVAQVENQSGGSPVVLHC